VTAEQARTTLTEIGQSSGPTIDSFAITRRPQEPPALHRILLDDALAQEFIEAVSGKARVLADLTFRSYGPAVEISRGEAMHAPADAGLLAGLEAAVATGDADLYDPNAGYVDHLRLMATRAVLPDGRAVTFYRELKPTSRLDRSPTFAALFSAGWFSKIVDDHVLLFDRRFDAIVTDGVALFTSKAVFERLFDFFAQVEASAKQTFTTITAKLRIDRIADMQAACTSNPAMMAKMASVQRRLDADPEYADAMTMRKLLRYVRAHAETGVEITGTGAQAQLSFHPDPARRYKILHLLDDDYLVSALTKRIYEANSKSEPL